MNDQPLAGWSAFAWSDRVLTAEDPNGRRWSVGEVRRANAVWWFQLVDIHGPENAVLDSVVGPTQRFVEDRAAPMVRRHGGQWPEGSALDLVLEDLAIHPRSGCSKIAKRTGLRSKQVTNALQRLRQAGCVKPNGTRRHATWSLARKLARQEMER